MAKRINPKVNVVIAFALAIGLGLSVTLMVIGGRGTDNGSAGSGRADSNNADRTGAAQTGPSPSGPRPTLPPGEATAAAIAKLSGLSFPSEMKDFRSVRFTNDAQIDVTFQLPASSIASFVKESRLPNPINGERLLMHSSPLWDLNPPEGATIASTSDNRAQVSRSVEFITAPAGGGTTGGGSAGGDNAAGDADMVTVRISLTPTG